MRKRAFALVTYGEGSYLGLACYLALSLRKAIKSLDGSDVFIMARRSDASFLPLTISASGIKVLLVDDDAPFLSLPSEGYSPITWARYLAPQYFDLQRYQYLLAIDPDCVAKIKANDLEEIEFDQPIAAYSPESLPEKWVQSSSCSEFEMRDGTYLCTGMTIINLPTWENKEISNGFYAWCAANERAHQGFPRLGQDALSLYLDGDFFRLDRTWLWEPGACNPWHFLTQKKKIVHWAGSGKPWLSWLQPPLISTWKFRLSYLAWKDSCAEIEHPVFHNGLSLDRLKGCLRYYFPGVLTSFRRWTAFLQSALLG